MVDRYLLPPDAPAYRPGLETPPDRIRKLPVHRGFPVPWFVAWHLGELEAKPGTLGAVPEFRAMSREAWTKAVYSNVCWVCGEPLGKYVTFVAGPMCGINRTSAEPPNHQDCAEWSARNCPFLSDPEFTRRPGGVMEHSVSPAGEMSPRNPGVVLLWTTKAYKLFPDGRGGVLINIGVPTQIKWVCRGRAATRAEVQKSIDGGLPFLQGLCQGDAEELAALDAMVQDFTKFLPRE